MARRKSFTSIRNETLDISRERSLALQRAVRIIDGHPSLSCFSLRPTPHSAIPLTTTRGRTQQGSPVVYFDWDSTEKIGTLESINVRRLKNTATLAVLALIRNDSYLYAQGYGSRPRGSTAP